jgi:hypothetical protein
MSIVFVVLAFLISIAIRPFFYKVGEKKETATFYKKNKKNGD